MQHILTTEQLQKLVDAVGNGKDWPKLTDDPRVNHAIDCLCLTSSDIYDEDGEPEYDEAIGLAEIEAARAHGVTFPVP